MNQIKIPIDYIAQSQMTIFNKAKEVFSKIGKNVFKNKYKNWDYYATPITIDGQNYIVEFGTVLRDNGQKHFRLERIKTGCSDRQD